MPTLFDGLLLLELDAVLICPGVVVYAGDLRRNFDVGDAGLNREPIAFDLLADDSLRELTDYRELVTEITVERFEPFGQRDQKNSLNSYSRSRFDWRCCLTLALRHNHNRAGLRRD